MEKLSACAADSVSLVSDYPKKKGICQTLLITFS